MNQHSNHHRFYLKLLAVALVIFGAKLWFIHHFGSPVPFWDEWTLARGIYLPWLNDNLTVNDLLATHNEHRPVFTRLVNLWLFILNKQWDPLLGMIVNAALSTLIAIVLIVVTRTLLGEPVANVLLLSLALLWTLPYGWENLVWSFQIGWYVMVLFSLLAVWGLLLQPNFTFLWWLGAISGFCAFFNLASGVAILFIIIFLKLYLMTIDAGPRLSHLPTILLGVVMASICLTLIAPAPLAEEASISTFLFALGSNLAWPWVTQPILSLLLYLPLFALGLKILWLRRKPSPAELWVLAIGGWVILQAAGLAYSRSTTLVYLQGAGPNSRYMETLALGPLMNLLAFHFLAQSWYGLPPLSKRYLNTYATLWGGIVIAGVSVLMFTNGLGGLPAIQEQAWRRVDQLNYTREFLLTGDLNIFKDKPFKHVPYYEPEELARLLSNPPIRALLPSSLAMPVVLKATKEDKPPTQEQMPFVLNGIDPQFNKYQNEEVLGSYNKIGNLARGSFLSTPLQIITPSFLEIPVTGYLGERGLGLLLVIEGQEQPITVVPPFIPQERWVSCYLPTPKQPFKLLAIDHRQDRWFALAMPRGVGVLSFWGKLVLQQGQPLFWGGIILLWFMFAPRLFSHLTTSKASL